MKHVFRILLITTGLVLCAPNAHGQEKPKVEKPPTEKPETVADVTRGAREKIEGAFGKNLGDVFPIPATGLGKQVMPNGEVRYSFTPKPSVRPLVNYYVLITPTTHKIYEIVAVSPPVTPELCKEQHASFEAALREKYCPRDQEGTLDTRSSKPIQGRRSVRVTQIRSYAGNTGAGALKPVGTLEIRYRDEEVKRLVEAEQIAIDAKKVKGKGL